MQATTGQWVEIGWTALSTGARAENIPDSTKEVPLLARVKGFALEPGEIGEVISVKTRTGRILQGELLVINPGYTHSFGEIPPQLIDVGAKLRELLEASGKTREEVH